MSVATVLPFPDVDRETSAIGWPSFVACSPQMRHVMDVVARVAPKEVPVLITGETGTGKEIVATALHNLSRRSLAPLVRVNCAAFPRDLVEAELFGHTRGAFTGAVKARPGFFGAADGGTLVLDEVEALPREAQAKLLRAVQQGELQTVGTEAIRVVDVRVIACSNTDLLAEIEEGRFRRDLYYRLAVLSIDLPPLRSRPEDVSPLVRHFASLYGNQFGVGNVHVTHDLLEVMQALPWPGNVRELENVVAAMMALTDDGTIGPRLLPGPYKGLRESAKVVGDLGLRSQVKAFERTLVHKALAECGNNRSMTARRLGISRTTLLGMLRGYKLNSSDGTG
jgi:two-component system response regulator AtoC